MQSFAILFGVRTNQAQRVQCHTCLDISQCHAYLDISAHVPFCARADIWAHACLLRNLSARQYINTRLFRSMSLSAYAYQHTLYSRAFGPFCFGHTRLSIWLLRSGAEYIYIQVQCLRYLDAFNDNHVASIWAIDTFSECSLDDALFIIWQVRLLTDDNSNVNFTFWESTDHWSCVNIDSMPM